MNSVVIDAIALLMLVFLIGGEIFFLFFDDSVDVGNHRLVAGIWFSFSG
jgi:hypothetical protein